MWQRIPPTNLSHFAVRRVRKTARNNSGSGLTSEGQGAQLPTKKAALVRMRSGIVKLAESTRRAQAQRCRAEKQRLNHTNSPRTIIMGTKDILLRVAGRPGFSFAKSR